jgi:hypothetical protein
MRSESVISQLEAGKQPENLVELRPSDNLSVTFKSREPCLPQREFPHRAEGRLRGVSEATGPRTAPRSNDRIDTEEVVRIEDITKI